MRLVEQIGFQCLDFTGQDALLLKELPYHHRDPFDRMLICQSLANKYKLMTENSKFISYECDLVAS